MLSFLSTRKSGNASAATAAGRSSTVFEMASARRTAQAMHPTNLHVNERLFPRDTVQSRLPDPAWLEQWLDKQIQFDSVWENKVVERILHNMSLLMERSFASVQELNRYRKELQASLAGGAAPNPA